ncbi:MAG: hypothetical protein ACOYJC_09840 [Christensenellales bacterium]
MKRKILAWLVVMALLLTGMAISPLTARTNDTEGEWVLVEVTDKTAEDWNYSYPDDTPPVGNRRQIPVCPLRLCRRLV